MTQGLLFKTILIRTATLVKQGTNNFHCALRVRSPTDVKCGHPITPDGLFREEMPSFV